MTNIIIGRVIIGRALLLAKNLANIVIDRAFAFLTEHYGV
jgi:hypothetical protein